MHAENIVSTATRPQVTDPINSVGTLYNFNRKVRILLENSISNSQNLKTLNDTFSDIRSHKWEIQPIDKLLYQLMLYWVASSNIIEP